MSLLLALTGVTGGNNQALNITLDSITSNITQTSAHAQSVAFTLDSIAVAVSQSKAGANSQDLAITLDSVTPSVTQALSHSQLMAITLDSVSVSVNQSKPSVNSQSLAITLDDVTASITQANSNELMADTHDGFWRKKWDKKKRKPIEAKELEQFITEESHKELIKRSVIADKPLFDYYTKSLEIHAQIAEKLERIYQAELDQDDEDCLMLLGIY